MSFLSNVKVGDEIVVNVAQYGADRFQIRTVTRVTKTQVTDSAGVRWRVSDGRAVGDGDRFSSPRALVAEPERLQRIRDDIEAANLRNALAADIKTAALDTLRAMARLVVNS